MTRHTGPEPTGIVLQEISPTDAQPWQHVVMRALKLSFGFLVGLVGGSCGDAGSDGDCQAGTIGCECFEGTCDVGLDCNDGLCYGQGGDGDGDGDGDGEIDPACGQYIECLEAVAPELVDMVEELYGPDSACWVTPDNAEQCVIACEAGVEAQAMAFPNEPACGGNGDGDGDGDANCGDDLTPADAECSTYCSIFLSACDGHELVFPDEEACLFVCGEYPAAGTPGDSSGDSVACRSWHACAAAGNPAVHCPHAAFDGGGVCI
jgi:hypothetical protein